MRRDFVKGTAMRRTALAVALVLGGVTAGATESRIKITDVSVKGAIDGENITFTIDFTIDARVRRPEIALATGDLVLDPSTPLAASRSGPTFRYDPAMQTYYVSWPRGGVHTESVTFAVRPTVLEDSAWREAAFTIPASNCRELQLVCDRADLEVRFPGAMKLEREVKDDTLTVKALLGPGRPFAVRWKPEVQKLEAKLVMGAEANTIVRAGTGALRVDTLFVFTVSQGELKGLEFDVPKSLSVTQVRGASIQDWHIDGTGDSQKLAVALTRAVTSQYAVQVSAEMALGNFPVEAALPVVEPLGVIRAGGSLAVGTDSALKIVVMEPRGLAQVDARAFPRIVLDREHPRRLPRANAFFYTYATSPYQVRLRVEDIVSSYDATERVVVNVREDDLFVDADVELDVRDAPLRTLVLAVDKGFVVAKVEGPQIADYVARDVEGAQEVEVRFAKPVLGRTLVRLRLELGETPLGTRRKVGAVTVRGAKSERGYIALAADRGVDLDAPVGTGLRKVHTASVPMRVPGAQVAYRFREGGWSLEFLAKKKPPSILSEAFHLVSIGEGLAYGSVAVSYHVSGAPVDEFTLRVPEELKNVEFVCRDLLLSRPDGDRWTVRLRKKITGDYNVLVTYTQPYGATGAILVGGIELEGVDTENGYVCVASRLDLKLAPEGVADDALSAIDREEVPHNYRDFVNAPVLASYRYSRTPHRTRLALTPYARGELVPAVVDMSVMDTLISIDNEDKAQSRTTVRYKVKNSREQFLFLKMPEGVEVWSVHAITPDGHGGERAKRVRASRKEGLLLVPLARKRDPNDPETIEIVYAKSHGALGWGGEVDLLSPMSRTRSTFARWEVTVPPDWAVYPAGTGMPSEGRAEVSGGLAGLVGQVGAAWEDSLERLGSSFGMVVVLCGALAVLVGIGIARRESLPMAAAAVALVLAIIFGARAASSLPDSSCARAEGESLRHVAFTQALNLDEGPHAASIRIVPLWRCSASAMGTIIVPVAALVCLIAGAFLRKQRAALASLGVAGLAYGAAQLPGLWPLLSHVLTWGVPVAVAAIVALSRAGTLVAFKHSRATAALLVACALFVPTRSHAAEKDPGVKAVKSVTYALTASGDHINIALALSIDTREKLDLPIMPGNAILLTKEDPRPRFRVEQEGGIYRLRIDRRGRYEVALEFLAPLGEPGREGLRAFRLAMPDALTNSVTLEIPTTDLEVEAPTAVRLKREEKEKSTVATAVFGPGDECIFVWKPRARQTKLEKTAFFAEATSLVRFDAGLAECRHRLRFQIAQGELKVITVGIPSGMTVTSVEGEALGTWRFDPAAGQLEARLDSAASGQYDLTVLTQVSGEGLPYTVEIGAPVVLGAERQRGTIGLATTAAVNITIAKHPAPMNVDDFARDAAALMGAIGVDASGVRGAYRYQRTDESLSVKVSEVRPEIRTVEMAGFSVTDDKFSYNGRLAVEVLKAGVFSLELELPPEYDIDSLTAPGLSHWDDATVDGGRTVLVHLRQKLMGSVAIALTMSRAVGELPGEIVLPRVLVKGVVKHTGQMNVKSERGVRLSVASRDGVSEADPDERGGVGAGVLVFRLLRPDWRVALKTELVETRTDVDFLHVARVSDDVVRHKDRLHFRVYNAGRKTFDVRVPADALGLEITGPRVASVKETPAGSGLWRVELADKFYDENHSVPYPLTVRYETRFDPSKTEFRLQPARAEGVDLQRGQVALFSTEKVELTPVTVGPELQPADARSIGRKFGSGDLSGAAFCYSTATAGYALGLKATRHETAQLLEAAVKNVSVVTIVTESRESLTAVRMGLVVGGKRYLEVAMPEGSAIWSLLVDNSLKVPSLKASAAGGDVLLVPLGQTSATEVPVTVEFVYVTPAPTIATAGWKLSGPRFDLPLSNIEWTLFLPKGLEYDDFEGSLDVHPDITVVDYQPADYERRQIATRRAELAQAKKLTNQGRALASRGEQRMAKQMLENAYNLSLSDRAANEDALMQLQSITRRQAVVGLVGRRDKLRRSPGALSEGGAQQLELGANFNDAQAERLESSLAKADSENLDLIWERIRGQQDAAAGHDAALKPRLPEDGKRVRLTGAIQVEPNAEMAVTFTARPVAPSGDSASVGYAAAISLCVFVAASALGALGRRKRETGSTEDVEAKRFLEEAAVVAPVGVDELNTGDDASEDDDSDPLGV